MPDDEFKSGYAGEKYDRKRTNAAGGDAPDKKRKLKDERSKEEVDDRHKKKAKKDDRSKKQQHQPESESDTAMHMTPSEIKREEAEFRALQRRNRFKRQWPEVTKVKIHTKPWHPPGPPQKMPRVEIEYPPLTLHRWIPPWARRKRRRPKLPRITPEEAAQFTLAEGHTLRKVWNNFGQVDKNKMMLQGISRSCNNKKYLPDLQGAHTGCIAFVARGLLEDKPANELVRKDVDDVIEAADKYYKKCIAAMKCYKGKPALQLNQQLPYFFFRDTKYTIKTKETDQGILARHPDNNTKSPDLMELMNKLAGTKYMKILTVDNTKHFLIWGNPPEQGGNVKSICYIFDPYMLDEQGTTDALSGAAGILRYPGTTSFVLDFLNNHADTDNPNYALNPPTITFTDVEIYQKEPIIREPRYDLDLKGRKIHCRSELEALTFNVLIDEKLYQNKHNLDSLSALSLATSKSGRKKRIYDFFGVTGVGTDKSKNQGIVPPVAPERPPPVLTNDQILALKGTEDFFLYTPQPDSHMYGRDDFIPLPVQEEAFLHSPADFANKNFKSQYNQVGPEKWILRATRHFATRRYSLFKSYTGISCCVAALAMLKRHRARAWNEDVLDETLDIGYNIFRESLVERHGPIRPLVLGELKETFRIRDKEYKHKERGIAVWGRLMSRDPKVYDICRGLEQFFKQSDSGILQIPGEYETAIWYEGGRYYLYHPWPADRSGSRVGLQDGGKACLVYFPNITGLCEYFMDNVRDMKRKPFSISDVGVFELEDRPEPLNRMKAIGPNRWIVRGHFHEGNERFPEDHRNKQATPTAITAIAMATVVDPSTWTPEDVDETLVRGDILYENTMEHLEKLGINFDNTPVKEEMEGEEEEPSPSGTLAAADVLPRFRVTEYDCIETDVQDSLYSGQLNPEPGSGILSLKDSIKQLFRDNKAGVITARGGSMAVWEHDDHYYFFDPHGCDENGYPTEDPRAGAALIRLKKDAGELADVIMGNLAPGADDSFNLSPVDILAAKLNPEIGAPEMQKENKAFEWLQKKTACILMGPRGENSALGKANERIDKKLDLAGRTLALPAAAAFCAAAETVPPPGMHSDHMYNLLDAGAEYYLNHEKHTGRKDINVDDLSEKFEMGANTFSIEVGESTRLPLRMPDKPTGEGAEDEGGAGLGEGEVEEPGMKEMKDILFKMWYDTTKPNQVALLLGDYHQLGIWMAPGGRVVAFDPAPTLEKGALTKQRIAKGDELRLQRIKDETPVEEGDEGDDEEAGGEGEEKPEPEPEFVPPEACPVLIQAASPGEFIDKLVQKGGLDNKQMIAPYWLYPVKVTNELTNLLKEKKPGGGKGDEEAEAGEAEEDVLVEALDETAYGPHYSRKSRTVASVRGQVAQGENYFAETPNRDNQDAANALMGIVVDTIEPYTHWKSSLIDAILKYGDRLYTTSLPNAAKPPKLTVNEVVKGFHVTNFNVLLDVDPETVTGDIRAGETGSILNLKRGIKKFFDNGGTYGVVCAKGYCVGIWKGNNENTYCLWEPHFVGPTGRTSPAGAAGMVLFSTIDELAETLRLNIEDAARPGPNKFTISGVNVNWELSKKPEKPKTSGMDDEGYEFKVLTAYVEYGKGRTILRGSRPTEPIKFSRDALLQSSASAIVGGCMSMLRRSHLWTYKIIDEIMKSAGQLFADSLANLGYEFRPGEDILLPLQVLKAFILGTNYIRYDLTSVYSGKLEQKDPVDMPFRVALEAFFKTYTHGIIWSSPYAVAIWRTEGPPSYYMFEPHYCDATGLRIDALEDGAACVTTHTSPKLMAHSYLQNTPGPERFRRSFDIYGMSITVTPLNRHATPPPLLTKPLPMVPATSKVDAFGRKRRADEKSRHHPPGDISCVEANWATVQRDKEQNLFKGRRNTNGWLVLNDGTQYMSANHSIACKKFAYASRGCQALACSVMAVAMSRVEDVCRWCVKTLDQILESGDQLYQDSYLHFHPKDKKILAIEQILRKFYTPGNCVCRVTVYAPRQEGKVDNDLLDMLQEFFREEKAGVLIADGGFAIALFKTPRGYYMFDPADRDRVGRAVAPPCIGKARACFSQHPTVQSLAEKLAPNISPVISTKEEDSETVHFEEPASFKIYGMSVSSLRRLNQHEK
ncbi:uncharacterized protein LOC113232197 [Hyposmocoma kahamanoa]|uniref:uncharacterized protein LOC113232197 n=1 Tax=Hyposmocoma kahamanoa TaxID=1477025 RepID=UPI000E6D763E|nr:uncharacterized protein LOC113232197 [Hyposmocoma kahamanoa]